MQHNVTASNSRIAAKTRKVLTVVLCKEPFKKMITGKSFPKDVRLDRRIISPYKSYRNLQFAEHRSSHQRCSIKKVFLKISQNSEETPVPKSGA